MSNWHDWATGNEGATLQEGEELAAAPSMDAFKLRRFETDDMWWDADVDELFDTFVLPRVALVDEIEREQPAILASLPLRTQLHQVDTLPRLAKRLHREYQNMRRTMYPTARSRGQHTAAQNLSVVYMWMQALRVQFLAERLLADIEQRAPKLRWAGTDFDFVLQTTERAKVHICPSSQPLVELDWRTLDSAIRMLRRGSMESGIADVAEFLEYWRCLWWRFVQLLGQCEISDAVDDGGGVLHPRGTTLDVESASEDEAAPSIIDLLRLVMPRPMAGGSTTEGRLITATHGLNHPMYTESSVDDDVGGDVRQGWLPVALPFVMGDSRVRIQGLLEYETIFYQVEDMLRPLMCYVTATIVTVPPATRAIFAKRVERLLMKDRAAAAAATALLVQQIAAHPERALSDALYDEIFRQLYNLFVYPGDAEFYTVRQLFGSGGSSPNIDAIHDRPFAGLVLSVMRSDHYRDAAKLYDVRELFNTIVEQAWTKGAQCIADGAAPFVERLANFIIYELVDKLMAEAQCPPEMQLQANCHLDFLSYHHVHRDPAECPRPGDLSRSAARCQLVHLLRRNFIVIPARPIPAAMDLDMAPPPAPPQVFEVPSFPAAVIVWLAWARFDATTDERRREIIRAEPLRYVPRQLQGLVKMFQGRKTH
jgi:hypothetical protein